MTIKFLAALAALMTTASAADLEATHILPGPATPGAITTVTATELCAKGYTTRSVRPDEDYTENLKKQQLKEFNYADQNPKHYEEDHLVSLEIGGHPSDPRNLWPEPYAGRCNAHVKDTLENRLHELVCSGRLPLAEAQAQIAVNWVKSYNINIRALSCQ